MLCPTCRDKINTHHIVQCQNCESIVDFVDADPSELPVIFNTVKCPICSDSREDGKGDVPYTFPEYIFD